MSSDSTHPIRIITATSLFDGHDATINMIRRLLQDAGAEVIHLGHNCSVLEVVRAALQEGVQGICLSSYQGGHIDYFKYMKDLLRKAGADYVKIFGGGGGVIIHEEKKELEDYGIDFIFHPDDGRRMGLEGMIGLIMEKCDFSIQEMIQKNKDFERDSGFEGEPERVRGIPHRLLGLALDAIDNGTEPPLGLSASISQKLSTAGAEPLVTEPDLVTGPDEKGGRDQPTSLVKVRTPLVLGVTGTGGAGKSSLLDELIQRFLNIYPAFKLAVLCVDPSKRKTGGSLLGDRIRMNSLSRPDVFMRSVASRGSGQEIAGSIPKMLNLFKSLNFDLILVETSGIGQANMAITQISDLSLYVMTSEFGARSQLEKIDMIDFANFIAINKADHRGSLDALRDVRKQYKRSRKMFESEDNSLPVFLTQAAQFNDLGVNRLFFGITDCLVSQDPLRSWSLSEEQKQKMGGVEKQRLIPTERQNYLTQIAETIRDYKKQTLELAGKASKLGGFYQLKDELDQSSLNVCVLKERESTKASNPTGTEGQSELSELEKKLRKDIPSEDLKKLESWDLLVKTYKSHEYVYKVRGRKIRQPLYYKSLSGTPVARVVPPDLTDWGDRLKFLRLENMPGHFPYTAGVFPLKRVGEDPTRMFAGEGTPERTNKRFHYLSKEASAKRLSTAFDSVTLYGFDPDERPDIFGKVGESGVSVCNLDDMKKLYQGFDLCSPNTSVSMTINGPAPMILAFFFNTAVDQLIEKKTGEKGRALNEKELEEAGDEALRSVRGTVQADILKEDQGQNTCIFSIDFALKMMGDIQEYFNRKSIKNFYSVSISGYHIAEAGANPISQVAFTLSNAFTFVEYYLARGMKVDDFAPNLSFFFSNGMDPEYSVIGRVARRIWAIAMSEVYGASARSQKLKYHIQTSGRSLHAQEIDFNDIRTTLQALLAIYDSCNSLHTNAFDEAITTPTEESVRRAMAIQMIINKEFGVAKNENPNQGSYFLTELTDLVEEAILSEFIRISERGGVLGAMETQYQRGKIQEESMHYEQMKHSGKLPIIGVNQFIDPKTLREDYVPQSIELARASREEKMGQLNRVRAFQKKNKNSAQQGLFDLKSSALKGDNIFEALIKASRVCSLYQMTEALFEVGGRYRRNL